MKKFFLYILLITSSPLFFPQNIKWENLSGGIVINHLISGGDLKKYWNNTPEAGLLINYLIGGDISLESSIAGAYLKAKPANEISFNNPLPYILLINLPAGVKYTFLRGDFISFNVSAGITNSTFIFTGKPAETLKENNIESEFGLFASAGFGGRVYKNFIIELVPGIQRIFSSPNLNLYRIGLKILFDL
ncbi:MAG TPA: hypothetical protein VMT35_17175 [Ignavibacteriaceae bacterium]|nr:hypothetical protein [Ignavibacteriaceae bacterium]